MKVIADNDSRLIWSARLNDRYVIQVQKANGYGGWLCMFEHGELMLLERVAFATPPTFGPDMADVHQWMETAEEYAGRHAAEETIVR